MKTDTSKHDEKIAKMLFSSVYPHYVTKVLKKGRTEEELQTVIKWLTGFSSDEMDYYVQNPVTFEGFFQKATLHPNAQKIQGVICGYRVEDIENPLTQKARYMDKLVDELAKGKSLEKILR